MHNAPAVHYPVGRSLFHGCLVLTMAGLGLVVIAGWRWAVNPAPSLACGVLVIFAVLAAFAAFGWDATRSGELVWTGQVWRYSISNAGVEKPSLLVDKVAVILDLQTTLLIRVWKPGGTNLWLWTERRQLPGRWLAHRRAVFGFNRMPHSANPAASVGHGLHGSDPVFGANRSKP